MVLRSDGGPLSISAYPASRGERGDRLATVEAALGLTLVVLGAVLGSPEKPGIQVQS